MDMDNTIVMGYAETGRIKVIRNNHTNREELSGFSVTHGYIDQLNYQLSEWLTYRGTFNHTLKLLDEDELDESLADGLVDTSTNDWYPEENGPMNISAFDAVQFSHPYIVSPYNCSLERSYVESKRPNFINSITGFDTLTCTISFIAALSIALLINYHFKLNGYLSKGPSSSGLWTVFSAIMKNHSPLINNVSKFLLTILSLFTFVAGVLILVEMIKSSHVSIYQPKVYHTLEDIILDRKAIVMIEPTVKTKLLEDSSNAVHRDILAKGEKTRKRGSIFHFSLIGFPDHKAILLHFSGDISAAFCEMKSSAVAQVESDRTYQMFYSRIKDVCFYSERIKDIESRSFSQPYSEQFTKKPFFGKYYKYTRRSFEMSLSRRAAYTGVAKALQMTSDVADCNQKPLKRWEQDYPDPIDLYYFWLSFIAILIPAAIALIVLIFERLYKTIRYHPLVIKGLSLMNNPTNAAPSTLQI